MKLDRSRFLMLTGAMSTAALAAASSNACSSNFKGGTNDDGGSSSGSGTSGSSSSSSGVPDAKTCLGETAIQSGNVDCSKGAANCQITYAKCTNIQNGGLKPGVAQTAAACIINLPTCPDNASTAPVECVEAALSEACEDTTAASYCAALVSACASTPAGAGGPFDQALCEKLAKGPMVAQLSAHASTTGTPLAAPRMGAPGMLPPPGAAPTPAHA